MKKVYLVMTQYSTDDCDGIDTLAFDTYSKAVKHFKEQIENEISYDGYWPVNAFENGVLQHNYELDCSPNYTDDEEHELWWYLHCKLDWYLHTNIELRILEIEN